MGSNQLNDRISDLRNKQIRLEEILMQEIEKSSTQPPTESGNNISEMAYVLIELWKIMGLF